MVNSIPQGGQSKEEKDVNFYDYDGTCLYSYTKEQFLSLTQMPENPNHTDEGLISEGWTGTLEQAKYFVSKCGFCDLGQYYHPEDNKTKIYLTLATTDIVPLYIVLDAASSSVTVDWGDNSEPTTFTGSTWTRLYHEYLAPGDFIISITVNKGFLKLQNSSGSVPPGNSYNTKFIKNIKKIVVCTTNTMIGNWAFAGLECPIIVSKIYSRNDGTIAEPYYRYRHSICICPTITTLVSSKPTPVLHTRLSGCQSKKVILPLEEISSYNSNQNVFKEVTCYNIIVPEGTIQLGQQSFRNTLLTNCVLPSTITDISNSLNSAINFYNFYILATTPPTVTSNDVRNLKNSDAKIYVPAESIEIYKTAENWSIAADNFYPLPSE